VAFSVWTVAWYMQSIELFCADFAIGFLPPATFLLATANITIVKMLHKEFEVWFTLGNMLGFSILMPCVCTASQAILCMQITGHTCSARGCCA
jgi:hypothetical protein